MNEMVTIPREEYDRLRAAAEDQADLQSEDRATAALAGGADELIPTDCANRLHDGKKPLRVHRDLRGLTQATLAEKAGVSRVTVAEIETGRKQGSIATLRALARALDVTLDDLTEQLRLVADSHAGDVKAPMRRKTGRSRPPKQSVERHHSLTHALVFTLGRVDSLAERLSHLDDDLALCATAFDMRDGGVRFGKGVDAVDDRADVAGVDQGSHLLQLRPVRRHE